MNRYGIINKSISYNHARLIYAMIGRYDYDMIQADDPGDLKSILEDRTYDGFNVDDPYKTEIIRYLDDLSEDARRIGAVNVVRREPDGSLKGYNSDIEGFKYMVSGLVEDKKCLILGTGCAALGCAAALEDLGASEVVFVSRDPDAAGERIGSGHIISGYNRLYPHFDSQVIINATPVGQLPDFDRSPLADNRINVRMFNRLELAVDLIYDPYRTKFLQDARRLTKCHTKSGLDMLVVRAIWSLRKWEDQEGSMDDEETAKLVRTIKRKILETQLNVIAVGMPGSGKTTIFRRYAYELGLDFIDTDAETEKLMGESIQNVLADGEAGLEYFRATEHLAVREACRHRGSVIATGGGTVLNPLNRDYLRSNGIVVYMRRPLDMLELKGRPLSMSRGVTDLFGERDRIYRRVSDLSILNARKFGGSRKAEPDGTFKGNSYNYELKGFVYYIVRKIERYLNEIADNKWT